MALAAIYSFRDGNGRTSRVVSSLAMYRGGFTLPEFTSLEEWWGRHLADYYAAFGCLGAAFDPAVDVMPFIRAHLEAQLHQVRALDLRERVQQKIWVAIEEAVAVAAGFLRPEGRARSRQYRAGENLHPRIGAALGVRVEESGDPSRAVIIGELTRRVVSEARE